MKICGASGLGDALFAYPIVKYFSENHETVHYMTNYPEIFAPLTNVKTYRHLKLNYVTLENNEKRPIQIKTKISV